MGERYTAWGEAAVGTDKTVINLFDPAATPTHRPRLYEIVVSSATTPADVATKMYVARTTAVGTEGSGFVPNNVDPAGPAGECDSGVAHSAEPTYTANKQLLVFSFNQRATYRWVAAPGGELLGAATQNNGIGVKSSSSGSTPTVQVTIFFME